MREGRESTITWQQEALSYLDALYGFAMALARDSSDAEDLVQETYLLAVKNCEQFTPDTNLKAWLFTIMRNARLKRLRRLRNCPDCVALDQDEVAHHSIDTNDPETLCIRIWEREEIRAALERLPDPCREIITLRDIEGFSYVEMSVILDCPLGTIMSRLSRARSKLKRILSIGNLTTPKRHHIG